MEGSFANGAQESSIDYYFRNNNLSFPRYLHFLNYFIDIQSKNSSPELTITSNVATFASFDR